MSNQFDSVSITKKANVHYEGLSISHVIKLDDGTKKTLGVILPTDKYLTFKTHVPERIELISGKCHVQIGDEPDTKTYSDGESFCVPENSYFRMALLHKDLKCKAPLIEPNLRHNLGKLST
ncbi:pyrimidine/purine nucleoside phosphorylase [Acinetobacter baumannii]|nr:pyrimidine/purine nucleoside phosphorylase [Acinetobacter baumannii]MDC5615978.1 pyrimidine/purine nucleoside phosphorylase [Acinetobacter baumannii]MDC5632471.1 pyrimidine/purine nucleoside phosphorylase [Acinetobacter baumannii]